MKELLYYIVKTLVDKPEAIAINEVIKDDGELVLELTVDPSDMGKVIGRQDASPTRYAPYLKPPPSSKISAFPSTY